MTTEQKAKAYDEALEKAKQIIVEYDYDEHNNVFMEIFHELKESEDEKVRKWLISQLKIKSDDTNSDLNIMINKAISWLEKQDEHAKFRDSIQVGDNVTRNENGVLVNLSRLNRVAKKDEKQGEQKPAWSEEDENTIKVLMNIIKKSEMIDSIIYTDSLKEKLYDWLKFIRPKNMWISVDKEVYVKEPVLAQKIDKSDPFKGYVVCCDHTLVPNVYERYMLLSNIISQNQWKPSKEQIIALRWVLNNIPYNKQKEEISGLLDQIKKLKEE